MTTKDGGPAFPQIETTVHMAGDHDDGYTPLSYVHSVGGMSLRDYAVIAFASAWVRALASRSNDAGYSDEAATFEANRLAELQADAMLAEREKAVQP